MSTFNKEYIKKNYLSSGIILFSDTIISVLMTFVGLEISFFLASEITITDRTILFLLLISLLSSLFSFTLLGTYRSIIRYSTLKEVAKLILASFIKVLICFIVILLLSLVSHFKFLLLILILDFIFTFILLIGVRVIMVIAYQLYNDKFLISQSEKILIYGVSEVCVSLKTRLQNESKNRILGFITYGEKLKMYRLSDLPIYTFKSSKDINDIMLRLSVDNVIFPDLESVREEKNRLLSYCENNGIKVFVVPPVDEINQYRSKNMGLREIRIEDLLGRKEIVINMDLIYSNLNNKTILVTGAAGSIGSELCRQIAKFGIQRLILFDSGETPMHLIRLELEESFPYLKFIPIIGDVRNKVRLELVFQQYLPNFVFHAAAYKHVPLMEENPCEAITTNVFGTRNVAELSLKYNIEKMIMISTDKAVNPTNVMGASKRLAEIYVQSLSQAINVGTVSGVTKFITTRFGNVLGSNGSVLQRFKEQIAKGGPVTVTHPEITRYFMTIPEACRLVLEATTIGQGSEIFVFDMGSPVKIAVMARHMIELSGKQPDRDVKIVYVGLRPGEKLYEEVLSKKEDTIETSNSEIRIAKAIHYDFDKTKDKIDNIIQLAQDIKIPELMHQLRKIVPEYHPQNSWLEKM